MIGKNFQYHAPKSADEAASILSCLGSDAVKLSGGTVVVQHMTLGHLQPKAVVDLRHIGSSKVRREGHAIVISARASYTDLERSTIVQSELPLLAAMACEITGGRQIRNQGTLGGSSCYANPASDAPGCLAVLGASFRAVSHRGQREISVSEFFRGAFQNALAPDEFLSEIVITPPPAGTSFGYYKLKFCTSSWPIVTASCLILPEKAGSSAALRVCIGGASPVPICFELPRSKTSGDDETSQLGRHAAAAVTEEWIDELAGVGYRRSVAASVVARAIRAASGGA